MFLEGSTDRWSWSEDAFPPVAFCVHALVRDGLKIPPFDRHDDGDGALRDAGLDAPMWREWVTAAVRARAVVSTVARDRGGDQYPNELMASWHAADEVLTAPGSACPGSTELRRRLHELWVAHRPLGAIWKERMTIGEEGVRSRLEGRWTWDALLQFHDRLPTISVFLVAYPVPVVMALPPTTSLIAPGRGPGAYGRQVVDAATQLAAAV